MLGEGRTVASPRPAPARTHPNIERLPTDPVRTKPERPPQGLPHATATQPRGPDRAAVRVPMHSNRRGARCHHQHKAARSARQHPLEGALAGRVGPHGLLEYGDAMVRPRVDTSNSRALYVASSSDPRLPPPATPRRFASTRPWRTRSWACSSSRPRSCPTPRPWPSCSPPSKS